MRRNASGNIEIYDAWGRNDRLKFERGQESIIVTDLTEDMQSRFQVIGLSEVTGDGGRQVTIPLSLIQSSGKPLLVNSMAGDDELIFFDANFNAPTTGFVFRAGDAWTR